MTDWRVRPLTKEMLNYARNDTHYLLQLYDKMRKELITRSVTRNKDKLYGLLNKVFNQSKEVSLLMYSKPVLKDYNYLILMNEVLSTGDKKATKILKILLKWRDYIARAEDKSRQFIVDDYKLKEMATEKTSLKEEIAKIPLFAKYSDKIIAEIELKFKKSN